jgi:uncharacterized protein YndB with AHSA1/START domain
MPDQSSPEKTVRDLVVTRILKAPPALVWSAFTDPGQLIKFFGPEGTTIALESVTVEPRVGGEFSLVMVNDDNGDKYPMNATYTELIENQRIQFETGGGITGTIEMTDLGNGETALRWTSRTAFDDAFFKDAEQGTNSAVDQLVVHLAAMQQ